MKVREDRYLGPFNLNNRQYQDVWMAVVYLTLLVLAWAVGIYAFSNRHGPLEACTRRGKKRKEKRAN